jgi:hypothetical protein
MEGSASAFHESYLEKGRVVDIEANIDVHCCIEAQIMIVDSILNINNTGLNKPILLLNISGSKITIINNDNQNGQYTQK